MIPLPPSTRVYFFWGAIVIRAVRPTYGCRACDKIISAPASAKTIARGKASFATLTHVVIRKIDHHRSAIAGQR